jgi:hypothetical protein
VKEFSNPTMTGWPLDGVLAASHEDDHRGFIFSIPFRIAVVGGENAIQRQL